MLSGSVAGVAAVGSDMVCLINIFLCLGMNVQMKTVTVYFISVRVKKTLGTKINFLLLSSTKQAVQLIGVGLESGLEGECSEGVQKFILLIICQWCRDEAQTMIKGYRVT